MILIKMLKDGEPLLYEEGIKGKIHPGTGEEVKKGDYKYMFVDKSTLLLFERTGVEFERGKIKANPVVKPVVKEKEDDEPVVKVIEPKLPAANPVKPKEEEIKSELKSLGDIWKSKVADIREYAKSHGLSDEGKKSEIFERIKKANKHK